MARSRNDRKTFAISTTTLRQISESIGSRPAEQGGALGGNRDDDIVTHFFFDRSARRTGATYSPDHHRLNRLFDEKWNPAGINLLGFVHSHPPGCFSPSSGDIEYAERILEAIPKLKHLYLPIVMTKPDTGRFELIPYAAVRNGRGVRIDRLELQLTDDVDADDDVNGAERSDGRISDDLSETFRRVRGAYDLDRLGRWRVIYVGVGGAAGFVEDMARAGVGEHVLIDPDVVSETNLATQQVYRKDLRRPKVECLAERLRDINPAVRVITRPESLDDIDDSEFAALLGPAAHKAPERNTLICGLTDNFIAQARVNRLALHFGVPSLSAQVYREGRGAEITFTYPGVTPACQRCVLSARYAAYLGERFENDVTSDGTPIFATTRLNALKGMIAMAILHHRGDHPRWGRLLERIGNRNLIQIRLDPDIASTLGLSVFDRVFGGGDRSRILFDDVVWLPQQPDREDLNGRPTCLDCGGTGDLRQASGTFADTRVMCPLEESNAPVP